MIVLSRLNNWSERRYRCLALCALSALHNTVNRNPLTPDSIYQYIKLRYTQRFERHDSVISELLAVEDLSKCVLHWSEFIAQGNYFTVPPSRLMLHPDGQAQERALRAFSVSLKVQVVYDRSYVVGWLNKRLIGQFAEVPYNELQSLLKEARAYKDEC